MRLFVRLLRFSAVAFAFSIFSISAHAAVKKSVISGDWNTGSTWNTGTAPTSADTVIISAGTVVSLGGGDGHAATVTVQSNALLDLGSSGDFTTGSLAVDNGGEVDQGGSQTSPLAGIASFSLAPDSTYKYYGSAGTFSGTHPVYGNLVIATTPTSDGRFSLDMSIAGDLVLSLNGTRTFQFGTSSRSHSIGGDLVINSGLIVCAGSSSAINVSVGGSLKINGGIFRGTNGNGPANFSIGGDIINNGTWQQDNGSGTGIFSISLTGTGPHRIGGSSPISFENLSIDASNGATLDRDISVTKTLSLANGVVDGGIFNIDLGTSATVSGGGGSAYIAGSVSKGFSASASFTFPVGTSSGYSPVTANVTSTAAGSGLLVAAFQGSGPGVDPANSVSRFWKIDESGTIVADLVFSYNAADVVGSGESSFSLVKTEDIGQPQTVCSGAGCVDPALHTASVTGVFDFSRWAIGRPAVVTAAAVDLDGYVRTASGRGVPFARISITDTRLAKTRFVIANQFGRFRLRGLDAGSAYAVSVSAKSLQFTNPTRVVTAGDTTTIEFITKR